MAEPEVIVGPNSTFIRFPRMEVTPFGNPNPVGGCTTDPFCQIWGHVVVTSLSPTRRQLSHLTPEQLQAEASAADG